MEVEAQRKDKERQEEEAIKQPEKPTMQEMAGEFSSLEQALLAFEARDPNVECCRKVAAAVPNTVQCHCVIHGEEKRAPTQTSLGLFSKG